MAILTAEQGVSITEKRVAYNKKHPRYCAIPNCGAKMTWDRVTAYGKGVVVPQKHVQVCGACARAGRKPPRGPQAERVDCGNGHDITRTASKQDGTCKVCRREEKERRDEERAMEAGREFVVGPTVKHKDRVKAHGLRRVMREKGSNGRKLGEQLGVNTKTVNEWASCRWRAPRAALEKAGEFLHVPVVRLIEEGAA